MCAICGRGLPDSALQWVQGVQVCLSARYCLVAWLLGASSLSIATLHASALDSTLRASESIPLKKESDRLPGRGTQRAIQRTTGVPNNVRLSLS